MLGQAEDLRDAMEAEANREEAGESLHDNL